MKNPIILDTFDGHLVLLCKGHYIKETSFFIAACRLWVVRCGLSITIEKDNHNYNQLLENIADHMYEILQKCEPNRMKYFHQVLHREISKSFGKPKNLSIIESLIWEYRNAIMMIQINEKDEQTNEWHNIIQIPTPQDGILVGICEYGWGEYKDYDKLVKRDENLRKLIH
jgi:hypothetical protein